MQNTLTNMRIEETIKRILREELSSHNGNESRRHKVFYGFQGLPNFWSNDYDRVINDSYFDDKDYNDYYFDNFYDMDKEFGHEKSLFGTKGLPVGHPNRSSKSFDMYNDKYGPAIVRVVEDTDLQKQEQNEGELTEKCWSGYTQKGMKTMFGKRYPNCVKKTK